MLFDMTAHTNVRRIMVLDPNFPKDVKLTIKQGETTSATFEAVITEDGRPDDYTYQWYVNDAAVEGANEATYTKEVTATAQVDKVYCTVTNKKGSVSTRVANLSVIYTPVLNSSYPKDVTVISGDSVTCKVVVSSPGNPAEKYQWYVNNTAVTGATGSSYTFTPKDSGKTSVYCKVTNDAGSVKSRTATITETIEFVPNKNASWSVTPYDSSNNFHGAQITKNNDSTYIKCNSVKSRISGAVISFSATKYNKLKIKCNVKFSRPDYTGQTFYIGLSKTKYGDLAVGSKHSDGSDFSVNKTFDISGLTGTVYLMVKYIVVSTGTESYAECTITEAMVSE